MRRGVVGLGVALAVGALAFGAHRLTLPAPPRAPVTALTILDPPPPPSPPPPIRAKAAPPARSTTTRIEQAASIATHVRRAAIRHSVPESLVAAVISVESEFNPRAVSRRGALGLMQLMPTTAALLGVRDAFDPAENVDAGARHLRDLLDRFANDLSLTLAAYNAGSQAVVRHGGVPPYPETRAFVARVLGRLGTVVVPTVAVVHAAAPPRVRIARVTADRLRRGDVMPERGGDVVSVSLGLVDRDDERIPVAVTPPPERSAFARAPASSEGPSAAPVALTRVEAP